MIYSKVPHQLHEEADVSHIVQKIWVAKLLGSLVAKNLLVFSSAVTVPLDNRILYHFAFYTFEVLELVANLTSVTKVHKATFYKTFIEWTFTMLASPFSILLVKVGITTNIHV